MPDCARCNKPLPEPNLNSDQATMECPECGAEFNLDDMNYPYGRKWYEAQGLKWPKES